MPASFASQTSNPDRLVASDGVGLLSEQITLLSGQNQVRGALLGKVTASGKYILSLSAAVDGSEVPVGVLAEDTDASAADVSTMAYVRGDFDENEITFGTGHTAASVREDLRAKGIQLIPSVTP